MTLLFLISCFILAVYAAVIAAAAVNIKSIQKDKVNTVPVQNVTVLIPCRNESANIINCLQSLYAQDFPKERMELLIIDDASEDDTILKAAAFRDKMDLRIVHANGNGKKNALKTGIDTASFPLILCTDADCVAEPGWISAMLSEFEERKLNMLCGPLSLKGSGSLFTAMQVSESAAVVGLSAVMLNVSRPSTCNGANLLFRKDVFTALGGYEPEADLASGDDDLLMQRFYIYDKNACRYTMRKDALVYTNAIISFRSFLQQRLRWLSKRRAYKLPYTSRIQGLVFMQMSAFWFLLISMCFHFHIALAFFIVLKWTAELIYSMRLKDSLTHRTFTVFLMPVYQLYSVLLLFITPFSKTDWKGRALR